MIGMEYGMAMFNELIAFCFVNFFESFVEF